MTKAQIVKEMTRTSHRTYVNNPIQRSPNEEIQKKLVDVWKYVVTPLQESLGPDIIVVVNSGYRCPGLNRAVGGVSKSFHKYEFGKWAVDLDLRDAKTGKALSPKPIFDWLKAVLKDDPKKFDLVYFEGGHDGWVHVQGHTDHSKNRGLVRKQ